MLLCFGAAWKMELWTNKKCEYYVSQKQNGFNNKIQWYSILLTFMFHRLSWTKIFVLSNLKNWQLSTWQYYKVGNCSIWGWPECDFSILGRVGGGGFHHNWDSRSNLIITINIQPDAWHKTWQECWGVLALSLSPLPPHRRLHRLQATPVVRCADSRCTSCALCAIFFCAPQLQHYL